MRGHFWQAKPSEATDANESGPFKKIRSSGPHGG